MIGVVGALVVVALLALLVTVLVVRTPARRFARAATALRADVTTGVAGVRIGLDELGRRRRAARFGGRPQPDEGVGTGSAPSSTGDRLGDS